MRVAFKMKKHLLMAGIALNSVILLVANIAHAQDSHSGENSDTLQTVTVTGSNGAMTPAGVSVVTAEDINRYGSGNLQDVIRDIPGTFTWDNPSQPGLAINIRGFEGSGRVNTMIDGVRQNFRFTGHDASGYSYVDSNLLTEIDVERGAVVGAGGGALAGSVNLRTLSVEDIIKPGQNYGVLGKASWGSNGVGFSEMIAGGARNDIAGVAAAISRRDSRDFKDGDGNRQSNTGQELTSGLVKAEFGYGTDHRLNLGGVFYNNDFGANSYNQNVKNTTLTANYSYNPTDNDWVDLHVNAYYNRLKMEYFENLRGVWGGSSGREIEDRGVGFDISNTSRFNLGEVGVKWLYGVEYFRDKIEGANSGVNPSNGTASSGGVFSDATFSYKIVDLTAGLRYNFYKMNGDAKDGTSLVDQSHNSVDPRITLAVNVTDWLQPYVTYSQSMRSPTLQETMVGGIHPGSTTFGFIANPNLEPEKQKGWELGVNVKKADVFTAGDFVRARAAYYDMDIKDYIVSEGRDGCDPLANRRCQTWYNNVPGTSRVRGFEAEALYDAGFAFANLSYTHTKSDLPGILPGLGASQYLPDNVFSIGGGARLFERKLTVGGRYRYVSSGKVSTYTGVDKSDGSYGLVDIFTTYKFKEDIELSFKVNNLFNKTYTPFLSSANSGQGRTFLISTQFRF
ncbi:TonB-dependent receptor domain-containing protein [Bartonella sp. HY406]|uniref:TonB-dependent receptor domain-containing protein n=1 Tax=Bartonella sp. HY406 TaxID=2979331 RepID=UPI0021C8BB95|nr:TonB-dependent receptor [Bartonella sp. HY406]UXN03474.1 TonB-dependent receptor [Bartonella sp. HY406]